MGVFSMLRERIAEDVAYFSSDIYAQVCAGVINTPEGVILIDTLAVPAETLEIKEYIEQRMNSHVRFVINTHYHADHAGGNFLFPGAIIIAHKECRHWLDIKGRQALEVAKLDNRDLTKANILLPDITIDQSGFSFLIGKRTIRLLPLPGHTPDGIGVFLEEERVLFSGDAVMPIPYIRDGNVETQIATLKMIAAMGLENIIQGHGDIVLRGEIDDTIASHISYLDRINKEVNNAIRWNWSEDELRQITIEKCGKSRILLNGLAPELHWRNLVSLYQRLKKTDSTDQKPRKK
jgi:cyclase